MITAWDLKGILGIMPIPAKEGAEGICATDTVELDEMANWDQAKQIAEDSAWAMLRPFPVLNGRTDTQLTRFDNV